MDFFLEVQRFLQDLRREEIEYALCGGLALAVYGITRATEDIDILIETQSLAKMRTATEARGFRWNPTPLIFKGGGVVIHRLFKAIGEDLLAVDLLLVTPTTHGAWRTRQIHNTDFGPISCVSPSGLIDLKTLRRSGQDEDDIRELKRVMNET